MKLNYKKSIIIFLWLIIIVLSWVFLNRYYENKRIEEYECTMTPCSDSPVRILTKEEVEAQEKERKLKEEYISEEDRIKIDEYNFEQLEKVKSVLDWLDKNSYSFNNLKEFNKKFNQNITPIKNCYFLSDRNIYFEDKKWGGGYVFGFKLYSSKYRKIYWNLYIAYPKYNLPVEYACLWSKYCRDDLNFSWFAQIISNITT